MEQDEGALREAGEVRRARLDGAMERYADGDEAAFSSLYDEVAPALRRFVLRQRLRAADAEDVVQQTFCQLHRHRDRFVRGAAVLPWLYAIARNLLRDAGRQRRQQGALERDAALGDFEEAPGLPADEALALRRREAALRAVLAGLPPAAREAFQLVKLEGLQHREAAAVLGISVANVKIRVHRAVVALRESDAGAEGDAEAEVAE
jgi:RNA polymerase sigma-70 factor (ECF subfamily)